jgi:hypothetical protein
MRRKLLTAVCATIFSLWPVLGQGITLAGTGYSDPSVIRVAPGQITTLFVTGLKTVLSQPVRAAGLPLPITLAGIAVNLNQNELPSIPVPLLSIQQQVLCGNVAILRPGIAPDCLITAITVQIPFELVVPTNAGGGFPQLGKLDESTELTISENGIVSDAFRALPVTDNLHVLTTCDAFPSPKLIQGQAGTGQPCQPIATHADGTLITADEPAQSGEEIVMYAFGLGQTSPAVATGTATPSPAPVLAGDRFSNLVFVQFDFRPNAVPSPPYFNPLILAPFVPGALFAGLTPGQVGLYQINVRIPSPLPPLGSCNTVAQSGYFPYNTVASNLTIDLGASSSFDGAPICVQPSQ